MAADRLVYKTALSLATIATSGLVRLIFSLLVGNLFDSKMLGHANVLVSAAVFATLLCSPGLGQSVARQMATRGLTVTQGEGRALLVRATALHHILCLIVAAGVGVIAPADLGLEQGLVIALTFSYGCYTYYKAVMYGVDYVRRYAVLELLWDALFLAALITVVVVGARQWVLAPMVIVYGGFSVGAHRAVLPGRRSLARVAAGPGMTSPTALVVNSASRGSEAPPLSTPGGAATGGQVEAASGDGDGAPGGIERNATHHVDDRPWWRAVGGYALVTTFGTASSAGFLQLSQVFAMRAGGEHAAGLFAAALSLVTPAYLLPRAISVVLFPAMARAAGRFDSTRVRLHLRVGTQVLTAALLPLFAAAGVLATAVLAIAYGRGYADGATTLVIMVWATWISVASVPAVNALSSDTGRAYMVPAAASTAGFAVGLTWWFVNGQTIESVAWGYLVGSIVQSVVPMIEAARRHGVPTAAFGARISAAAAVGIGVGLGFVDASLGLRIVATVAVAAVAAAAVLPELRSLRRIVAERQLR